MRRSAPFATLPQSALEATLDMLSGRYPSDDFAELRPRITWDRVTGVLAGRPGAQRLAVTSGGTIPDRGMFGVFLVGEKGSRVGELDEEMVYESRVGDVFLLGSSAWRIEDITHDRVLVTPAPGQPGRMPYWTGDAPGRPVELGRALGAFLREVSALSAEDGGVRLREAGLDAYASANLLAYLAEQREATGVLPDDRTILVERFRDELGDWRLAIHSPFGAQVNQPWALALTARLRESYGVDVQSMHSDDGIVLRLPETEEAPSGSVAVFEPAEVEPAVQAEVGGSALFASRFRECAARALLLPRRNPTRRTPLWQQRQRSAQLLQVASQYGSFPVVLETMREVLQDVFDVPGLTQLMRDVEARKVRLVEVETQQPSPFARSLLFGYIGAFMYEGDAPLAERRAQALSLDSALLAELLGQAELRELIDADALAEVEAEVQLLTEERRAKDVETTADLLRRLGDLTTAEAVERGATPAWLAELEEARRAIRVRIAGEERWAAIEDSGRLQDALGTALPVGVPEAFTEPVRDPLGDLVSRYARTHGPFHPGDAARRFGLGVAVVDAALARLSASGRVAHGEFRPGGTGLEWCDAEVLRMLRRRSLAKLRKEVEPVPPEALARFLPQWQGLGAQAGRGVDGLLRAVEQLQGARRPGVGARVARAAVAGGGLLARDARRAHRVRRGAVGRRRLAAGQRRLGVAADRRRRRPRAGARARRQPHAPARRRPRGARRRAGAVLPRAVRPGRLARRRRPGAARCGTSSGPAGSPTTPSARCARCSPAGGRPTARARRPRASAAATAGRSCRSAAGRRPPPGAGRCCPSATRTRRGAPTRSPRRCSTGTASSRAARSWPSGRRAGSRPSTRCSRRTRRPAGCGGATSWRGSARRSSPRRVRSTGCARSPPSGRSRRRCPGRARCRAGGTPPARPPASASAATTRARWCSPPPTRPTRTAARCPGRPQDSGHRPGRKAGALVVLVDGKVVLYVERGGKTLLSFSDDDSCVAPAADALALAVRDGALGKLTVEKADGEPALTSPLGLALEQAGFRPTPRGLRLRA